MAPTRTPVINHDLAFSNAKGISAAVVPNASSAQTDATESNENLTSRDKKHQENGIQIPTAAGADPFLVDRHVPTSIHTIEHASTTSNTVLAFAPYALAAPLDTLVMLNGSDAISQIAYYFSDIIFIYPAFKTEFVGQGLLDLAAKSTVNAHGSLPKVIKSASSDTTSRVFEGTVRAAASSSHALKVSAVLSSASLEFLLPSLFSIADTTATTVLHVASHHIGPDLGIHSDYTNVIKSAHTGVSILASSTVQEAYDMAIAAHAIAAANILPVIHLFDGTRTIFESTQIRRVKGSDAANVVKKLSASMPRPSDIPSERFAAISTCLDILSSLLFAPLTYRPFEYNGPSDASVVIIAMGIASALARDAVSALALKHTDVGIGCINVRVYRPWSPSALIEILPASASTIIVIGDTADTQPDHSIFTHDVVSAIYAAGNHSQSRNFRVAKTSFGRGALDVSSHAISKYVTEVLAANARDTVQLPTSSILSFDPRHDTDTAEIHHRSVKVEAIFADVVADSTRIVSETIAHHLAHPNDSPVSNHVQIFPQHYATSLQPKLVTHLRFGSHPINSADPIVLADLAMCHNVNVLSEINVALSIRRYGKLFLNTSLSANGLGKVLPEPVLHEIVSRRLNVYALNVAQIVRDFTIFYGKPAEHTVAVLEIVFWRLSIQDDVEFAAFHTRIATRIKTVFGSTPNVAKTMLNAVDRAVKSISAVDHSVFDSALAATGYGKETQPGSSMKGSPTATIPANLVTPLDTDVKNSSDSTIRVVSGHHASLAALFPAAFNPRMQHRPDLDNSYQLTVTKNIRLTPDSYDRNVFHIEFDTTGTGFKYNIGDALGVYAHNCPKEVAAFLQNYGMDGSILVSIERKVDGRLISELRSLEQLFIQVIDVFGKPAKRFYQLLLDRVVDEAEKERLMTLLDSAENLQAFIDSETPTYADLLQIFASARFTAQELVQAIPSIKPRHYSISSSQRVHPNSVHLLVVLVDWKTVSGKTQYGQATRYLVDTQLGTVVTVSIKPSALKLPQSLSDPVIMSGLGTGMAPFRAFIEERWYWRSKGYTVGPMALYFGSRHRAMEYLYGEELDAYMADGLLTHLRLAFSRDQKQKVYIQHHLREDADLLNTLLLEQHGTFYLCGPTWPVPDVADALTSAFARTLGDDGAKHMLETLKEEDRFILEVY